MGELKAEMTFRTGFLQAGHWVNGFALNGRSKVNLPPQTLQSPSLNSYSYNGIVRQIILAQPDHIFSCKLIA